MTAIEVNFDGIVGPTHNYAGLALGNLASRAHRGMKSNPKAAALQGLAKMKLLMDLGVPQGVLPPQDRPDVATLRRLGYAGDDEHLALGVVDRELLASVCSASSMWAANAATVSPSADTADGRVHFTPANLVSQFHRSLETATTAAALRAIFPDPDLFVHHDPLPGALQFCDEGAANHTRLCRDFGLPGVAVFVYDRVAFDTGEPTTRLPARQTDQASLAVATRHGLRAGAVFFVRQNPVAIDAGVFHNDVICVGHRDLLLLHRQAFVDQPRVLDELGRATRGALRVIQISPEELSLSDVVATYLFNSQLVTAGDGTTVLMAPTECRDHAGARACLERIAVKAKLTVRYINVRQSMANGGGPACLRLRVVLTERERSAVLPGALLDEARHARLVEWVNRHYRDELSPDDLSDPALLRESRAALDELTRLLGLGAFYRFQR